jgi:hypothetical protein
MWGGAPYEGVSAEYRENSGQPPYEVAFFYSGRTLAPGTVLWDVQTAGNYSGMFPSRGVSAWTASLVFSLILIVVFFAPSIVGRRGDNRVYEGFSDKSGSDRHKKLQHGL